MNKSDDFVIPKLSICIPTYNRADMLEQCLASIHSALTHNNMNIEILISNNNSSDHTNVIINTWLPKFRNIRVWHQESNIGPERNFLFLSRMAVGDYLWIFGDDDQFHDDTLEIVNKSIASNPLADLILLNFIIRSRDMKVVKRRFGIKYNDSVVINNKNMLLEKFSLNLGFISSVIIKRDLFNSVSSEDYEFYAEFGFSFAFAVYRCMPSGCCCYYYSRPAFSQRAENSGDYDWYHYFVKGSSRIFNDLAKYDYGKHSIREAKKKVIFQYVVPEILVRKRDNRSTKGVMRTLFDEYYNISIFWLIILPILLFPNYFFRYGWRLYAICRSRDSYR